MQVAEIQLATRKIQAYFWDSGLGTGPGVLLLPDLLGVNPSIKNVAQRLAQEGYHVLLPDLYSGRHGAAKYCMRLLFDTASRLNEDNSPLLNEMHNILDFFKGFPYIAHNQIGVIGISLTGGFALHLAQRPEVATAVVFHHAFGTEGAGIPLGCLKGLNKPIQGHFVDYDPLCPSRRVDALKRVLENKLDVHIYHHTPHALPHLFRLHPQGKKAWLSMLHFLQHNLH